MLPPTPRPELLAPSSTGSRPPVMRSSVQKSRYDDCSSETKSRVGSQCWPASRIATENPASANLAPTTAPLAPAPTTQTSTSSRERSRIGTEPPLMLGAESIHPSPVWRPRFIIRCPKASDVRVAPTDLLRRSRFVRDRAAMMDRCIRSRSTPSDASSTLSRRLHRAHS